MRLFPLMSCIVVIFLLCRCRESGSDDVTQKTVDAEILAGAEGFMFTGQTFTQASDFSALFFYDFKEGVIKRIRDGFASNSSVFRVNNQNLVFNRSSSQLGFYTVNKKGQSSSLIPAGDELGDPWQVIGLDDSKALIANRVAGEVVVFDLSTQETIQTIQKSDLQLTDFYPTALLYKNSKVYVLDQGFDGQSHDLSKILVLSWESGQLNYSGEFLEIEASLVGEFLNVNGPSVEVASFCPEESPDCQSGAFRVNLSNMSLSELALPTNYTFDRGFRSGNEAGKAFVVAKNDNEQRQVLLIDMDGGTHKVLHTYEESSDRLYLLHYVQPADRLFVGDEDGSVGLLRLYNGAGASQGSYKIDARPYHGALIP